MTTILIIAAIGAALMTFFGGLFALRVKDKMHIVLGLGAGAVLGIAFFDLIPESIELAENVFSVDIIALVMAISFFAFMVFDRMLSHCHDGECEVHGGGEHDHTHNHAHDVAAVVVQNRTLGVRISSFILHSFIDGLAVALAFQASNEVGFVVTVGILIHAFSDGINTAGLVLRAGGGRGAVLTWIGRNAVGPVLGILTGAFIKVPDSSLALLLAVFAGFFIYLGGSDLLPESHHRHPTFWTTAATLVGAAVIFAAIQLAHV